MKIVTALYDILHLKILCYMPRSESYSLNDKFGALQSLLKQAEGVIQRRLFLVL